MEAPVNAAPTTALELLGIDEVAALLSVHVNTVRRLYNREGLPYLRFGRTIRFRKSDVEDWLASKKVTAVSG